MREIKFRGHDGLDWIYGSAVQYDKETETWYMIETGGPDDDWTLVYKVGQYIGLEDIYEKELYEGDVVTAQDNYHSSIPPFTGTITFMNGSYCIDTGVSKHYRWMDYTVKKISSY